MAQYTKSSYFSSPMTQLVGAYLPENQPKKSSEMYQRVVTDYPSGPATNQSLLQLGMIYYNQGDNEQALNAWKQVAEKDKNSNEGNEALSHIKMLYVSQGEVSTMQDYLAKLGVTLGASALDS